MTNLARRGGQSLKRRFQQRQHVRRSLEEFCELEAPLRQELSAAGLAIRSVSDWNSRNPPPREAIPILIGRLQQQPPRVRSVVLEGLVSFYSASAASRETTAEVEQLVLSILSEARATIPERDVADLPPMKDCPDVPEWHDFEHSLWRLGEQVRQLLGTRPKLRAVPKIQSLIVQIATDSHAKRGRQSFVSLLGYKSCLSYAEQLAEQLNDESVDGHVIGALRRMQASGFSGQVRPFLSHGRAWIRAEAKKYLQRFEGEPPA